MGDTEISWTHRPGTRGRTWNAVKGCSRVSAGCQRCYAETQAARIVRMGRGKPTVYDDLVRITAGGEPRWTGKVVLDAKTLAAPLKWRQPSTVFANSMSDLFHESLTNEQIAAVFGVMAACPQHTFQVLTKRAKRMREWFEWFRGQCGGAHDRGAETEILIDILEEETPGDDILGDRIVLGQPWPLPHCWLGVSVENQESADERGDDLRATPAAVHFWSVEPQLGDVDARRWLGHGRGCEWLINGCESGPNARPCDGSWFRSLRDQCEEAGVPYFLKQAVEQLAHSRSAAVHPIAAGSGSRRKLGGVIELPYLDGHQHTEWPA